MKKLLVESIIFLTNVLHLRATFECKMNWKKILNDLEMLLVSLFHVSQFSFKVIFIWGAHVERLNIGESKKMLVQLKWIVHLLKVMPCYCVLNSVSFQWTDELKPILPKPARSILNQGLFGCLWWTDQKVAKNYEIVASFWIWQRQRLD